MTIAKRAYEHYEPAGKDEGFLPLVEGMRVLEVGFGTGKLLEALRDRGNEVYGVDVGEDIVEQARQQGHDNVLLLDVSEENLPYDDDFFDAVYCYEVIEHLTNPHRMFTEIRRVLKRDHCLYFSAPAQEIDMGYGNSRHPFVYPGLLEKANLERFFMQMYFRVEEMVEAGRWLEGRSYVLRNKKDPKKPDIVEVITGPHNLVELYRDVLTGGQLEAELAREIEPYLGVMLGSAQAGDWDDVQGLYRHLREQFPRYLPLYIRFAKILVAGGRPETAADVLRKFLEHPHLPEALREDAEGVLRLIEAGGIDPNERREDHGND